MPLEKLCGRMRVEVSNSKTFHVDFHFSTKGFCLKSLNIIFQTESKEEEYGDDALLEITNNSTRNLSDSATDSLDVDSDDNVSTRLSTSDTCDHDKVGEDVKSKKSNSETLVNCDECQLDSKHDKKTVKNILSQILTSNKDYVPLQVCICSSVCCQFSDFF